MWGHHPRVHERGKETRAVFRPGSAEYKAAQQRVAAARQQQHQQHQARAPTEALDTRRGGGSAPDDGVVLRRQTSHEKLDALHSSINAERRHRQRLETQAAAEQQQQADLVRSLSSVNGSIGSLLRARRRNRDQGGGSGSGGDAGRGNQNSRTVDGRIPVAAEDSSEDYSDDEDFETHDPSVALNSSPVGSHLLHAYPVESDTLAGQRAGLLQRQPSGEALQHERAKRQAAEQTAAQQASLLQSLTQELNKQNAELRREREDAARARTAASQAAEKAAAAEAEAAAAASAAESAASNRAAEPPLPEPQTCVICFDEFTLHGQGVACDGPEHHYLCVECFQGCVDAAVDAEPRQQGAWFISTSTLRCVWLIGNHA